MKSPVQVFSDVSDDRTARDAGCGCADRSSPNGEAAKPLPILVAPMVFRAPLPLPQASPCCGPLQPAARLHGARLPLNRMALPRPVAASVLAPAPTVPAHSGLRATCSTATSCTGSAESAAEKEAVMSQLADDCVLRSQAPPATATGNERSLRASPPDVARAPIVGRSPSSSGVAVQRILDPRPTIQFGPYHFPRYPQRDSNRPLRLRTEKAIVIRAWNTKPVSGALNPFTIAKMQEAVNGLARNNSYGQCNVTFDSIGSFPFFELPISAHDFPPKTPTTPGLASPEGLVFMTYEFYRRYQRRLSAYDHVIIFVHDDSPPSFAPSRSAHITLFPDSNSYLPVNLRSQDPTEQLQGAEELAAGIFHEMGHGYRLGHANLLNCGGTGLDYGDIYDYMGGMTGSQWRFRTKCWPTPAPVFAPPTEIQTNPVRKWQHGWITDADVIKATTPGPTPTKYSLAPLHPSGVIGPVAIEIDRGYEIGRSGFRVPTQLFVYWRGNEPQVSGGVCVSIVSKQLPPYSTRLLEQLPGPMANLQCPSTYPFFPGYTVSIPEGGRWTDPISGASIECLGVISTTNLREVEVTLPARPFQFQDLPIVDLICPLVESHVVVRKGDKIRVEVDAAIPTRQVPWNEIDRAELSISAGDAMIQPLLYRTATIAAVRAGGLPVEVVKTIYKPTEVWEVPVGDLAYNEPQNNYRHVDYDVPILGVHVFTKKGTEIIADMKFILDQT